MLQNIHAEKSLAMKSPDYVAKKEIDEMAAKVELTMF